ncbi:MAG: HAD-IA family hydrolase [Mycobacteriaceae bacterium]
MQRGRNRGSEAGIVFDLDGTLVDSAPSMTRAINEMACRRGAPPVDVAAVRRFVSLGGTAMLAAALGEQTDPVADLDELRTLLREQDADPNDLYPGVVDTLAALKQDRYRIGVCTNKSEDIAVPYAAGLGIAGHLDVIIGGAPGRRLKPDPQLAEMALERLGTTARASIFVGDSEIDAETAAATGIPFVLVTFGYPHGAIETITADARIDHFSELPGVARTMCEPAL